MPGPLQRLDHPVATAAGVRLFCKRDDLYSPASGTALQGNKVRKLSGILQSALAGTQRPLLVSFGGAFSNHLSALATAGRVYGLRVVVFVRGEEVDNPLLRQATADGADLIRISRTEYRRKHDEDWLAHRCRELCAQYDLPESQIWFIPEGGTSAETAESVAPLYREIVSDLGEAPDFICLSAGTGGTAAGLISTADIATRIEVYPALKGNWMGGEIKKNLLSNASDNWTCVTDYHFGGYGKFPKEWVIPSPGMAKRAYIGPGLPPLEPVYTAKLFSGVLNRLRQGCYPSGSTLVVLHTGGIY